MLNIKESVFLAFVAFLAGMGMVVGATRPVTSVDIDRADTLCKYNEGVKSISPFTLIRCNNGAKFKRMP